MISSNASVKRLYRDPQQGKIAGVCAGFAHYFGVELWIVRILAVSGLIFGTFITLLAYIAAWLLLDKQPVMVFEKSPQQGERRMKDASWQSGMTAQQALMQLQKDLDGLEPRLQRLEKALTSKEFWLTREFHKL